jgi:hypothetical protein
VLETPPELEEVLGRRQVWLVGLWSESFFFFNLFLDFRKLERVGEGILSWDLTPPLLHQRDEAWDSPVC